MPITPSGGCIVRPTAPSLKPNPMASLGSAAIGHPCGVLDGCGGVPKPRPAAVETVGRYLPDFESDPPRSTPVTLQNGVFKVTHAGA